MSVELQEVKRSSHLAEWAEMVRSCKNSGLTVQTWCREHGLNEKTYYHRQIQVAMRCRERCVGRQSLPKLGRQQSLQTSDQVSRSVSAQQRSTWAAMPIWRCCGIFFESFPRHAEGFQWRRTHSTSSPNFKHRRSTSYLDSASGCLGWSGILD